MIAAYPRLRERELIKLASPSRAPTAALEKRGHDARTARPATDAAWPFSARPPNGGMAGENTDHARLFGDRAADLLAVLNAGGAVRG